MLVPLLLKLGLQDFGAPLTRQTRLVQTQLTHLHTILACNTDIIGGELGWQGSGAAHPETARKSRQVTSYKCSFGLSIGNCYLRMF